MEVNDLRKWLLMLVVVALVIINLLWLVRWESMAVEESERIYKRDRITDQVWLGVYPPLAVGYLEIPLLEGNDIKNNEELIAYLEKHVKSGYIVDTWRTRDKVTHTFVFSNIFLSFNLLILIALSIRSKNNASYFIRTVH